MTVLKCTYTKTMFFLGQIKSSRRHHFVNVIVIILKMAELHSYTRQGRVQGGMKMTRKQVRLQETRKQS